MRYTCASCNRELVTRKDELAWTELASGIRPVPWHASIHEDGTEPSYCCADCIAEHDGLGKFEAHRHDRAELGKALILYAWSMDSSEDDFMSSEGWGYCGMFGRFLLIIDDRGAVSFQEYSDVDKAQATFDHYYSEGWGASESDAYVGHEGYGRLSVSFDGKPLDVWAPRHTDCISERRALARIRLEMMRTGYYPNVWMVSDHGNLRIVKGL